MPAYIPLTVNHEKDSLSWCRENLSWTEDDWVRVLFCEDTVWTATREVFPRIIDKRARSRYQPSNIVEKDHYDRGCLMVWAGIMADGNTHISGTEMSDFSAWPR
ncbi:hypothetical protein TNCV_1355571 [Trichonephila clavipes]|uniref:Uncharacterized protein n=1 Tax=Trichonephila clavipes TaxID=2585209 RepID=A0A8X6S7B1_TRICX|nr:hypothetical protein TNCV_1355571 [Trichonephila clavipes]